MFCGLYGWTEIRRTLALRFSQPLYAPGSGYLDPCREAKAAVSTVQPSGASGDMSKTFGPLNQGLLPPRWWRGLNWASAEMALAAAIAIAVPFILSFESGDLKGVLD